MHLCGVLRTGREVRQVGLWQRFKRPDHMSVVSSLMLGIEVVVYH